MGALITNQAQMFLSALLLGAVVGVLYDFFRVTRMAFRLSALAILLEDLLFFLLAAVLVFRFFLEQSGGVVRLFALGGMVLGWVIYFFSAGAVVTRAAGFFIAFFAKLVAALLAPATKMAEWAKKHLKQMANPLILQKNRLKSRLVLLYNRKQNTGSKRRWSSWLQPSWKNPKKKKRAPPSIR